MREIKFRGYQEALGYFVHGSYTDVPTISDGRVYKHWIVRDDGFRYVIKDEKTIGQYTGLKDINGQEIYEGDLCLCDRNINDRSDRRVFVIEYQDGSYFLDSWEERLYLHELDETQELVEIVGNVHENPELLKR